MHCISSNKAGDDYYIFCTKRGRLFKERRLFQILLTGSCALYILFYYPNKTRKVITYGLFKTSKFGSLINFQCQYPQHQSLNCH